MSWPAPAIVAGRPYVYLRLMSVPWVRALPLLLFLGACPGRPQQPLAAPPGARILAEHFVLANGLRVFLLEDHATPIVTAVTWFQVGSKDEGKGRTGFAHLFEHLMFTGSPHAPHDAFDVMYEEAGGSNNAWTDNDSTVYHGVAPRNFLERALWLEADRLAGLDEAIDQQSLEAQRDVVRNERRQHYDNQPYGMAEVLLAEALWPEGHGYHWPTIGYHEDLVAASLEDVKSFFRRYYLPNNATLVIGGDIDPKEARALVEKYYRWIPSGPAPSRPDYPDPEPIPGEIRLSATDDVQVPKLFVAWRGARAFSEDEAPLELLAMILGDGKASRLYQRLVYRERLAQTVSVFHWAGRVGGSFVIEVLAKPNTSPEALVAAVTEEVQRVSAASPASPTPPTPPTEDELERAKNLRESRFLVGLERVQARAMRLALYDTMAGDADFLGRDLERYRKVTPGDLQAAATRFLPSQQRVVLVIGPEAK